MSLSGTQVSSRVLSGVLAFHAP